MKARPIIIEDGKFIDVSPEDATHIEIYIPSGYHERRLLPVQIKGSRADTGNWTWNGDIEKPTLKPSILTQSGYFDGEKTIPFRCHTFVNDGMVKFLNDCTHDNRGKDIELLDIK